MNIVCTQNQVGQFNFAGDGKTLSFYMSLRDDNRITVEENGVKAILRYSGDPDEQDAFASWVDEMDIGSIFDKCVGYSHRVWASTDYKAQCLLFAKLYTEHFDELAEKFEAKKKREIATQIERLENELKYCSLADCRDDIKRAFQKQIDSYKKSILYWEKEREQLKEGSEKALTVDKTIESFREKIMSVSSLLQ